MEVSAHFPLQNLDNTHHGILDSGSLEVSQEPLEDLIFGALAVQIERVLLHVVDTLQEMTVYLHFYRFVKLFFCSISVWGLLGHCAFMLEMRTRMGSSDKLLHSGNGKTSSWRTITKLVWQLGGYKLSPPSTKDNRVLIVTFCLKETIMDNIFSAFNKMTIGNACDTVLSLPFSLKKRQKLVGAH